MDRAIHYCNQDGRVQCRYGTPSGYASAKLTTPSVSLAVNDYDLFPYADGPNAQWSGYFVSRASLKGYVRDTSSYFQAAKLLQVASGGAADTGPSNPLYRLERALGVAQHHDGVSGTSKQHVAYDYARRLAWGREDGDKMIAAALAKLSGYAGGAFVGCDLSNATICPALEAGAPTVLLVFNSQAQAKASLPLRVPVGMPAGVASWAVFDAAAAPVTAQLLPPAPDELALRTGYYRASAANVSWLAWQCAAVPAGGYSVFFLLPRAAAAEAPQTHASRVRVMRVGRRVRGRAGADESISNGVLTDRKSVV